MKTNTNLRLIISVLLMPLAGTAARLQLSDDPLYLDKSVPPALAITLDDSGSMAWGVMPDKATASLSKPGYQWGHIVNNRVSVASPDLNTIYYDPNTEYKLPIKSDGTLLPEYDFDHAPFNGFRVYQNGGSMVNGNTCNNTSCNDKLHMWWNLEDHYKMVWRAGATYTNNYIYGYQLSKAGLNQSNSGRASDWDRAFYYSWNGPNNASYDTMFEATRSDGDSGHYTLHWVTGSQQEQNFSNWFTYYNTRSKLSKSSLSYAFVDFGPEFKIDWQQLNYLKFGGTPHMNLFDGNHRTNFFDWIFTNREYQGATPLRISTKKVGELFEKGPGLGSNSPYYDQDYGAELSCQQNFNLMLSDGGWNTDAAEGINWDEDNVPRVFPDGAHFDPTTSPMSMYADSVSKTLADNALYYWRKDLRADLPNKVPRYIGDYTDKNGATLSVPSGTQWWDMPELYWNPINDPANWQHMVSFNIGIGTKGNLDPATDMPAIRAGIKHWPSPYQNSDAKIDDVWHASINSRGKFLSANNPNQLASSLHAVISNILTRKGRASAGSVSSNVISNSSQTFKTGFDTSNWSGYVIAAVLNPDGSTGSVNWDAGCFLTGGSCASLGGALVNQYEAYDNREIFSYDPASGNKVEFSTGDMTNTMRDAILDSEFVNDLVIANAIGAPADIYNDIVDYIHGNQDEEAPAGRGFRARASLLGDVVHSSARIVRAPAESYKDDRWQVGTPEYINAHQDNSDPLNEVLNTDDGYNKFVQDNKHRTDVLLIGSNDGMLHAFNSGIEDATTEGKEMWAFIPSAALKGLSALANPKYTHKSFVDASPRVSDIFMADNNWHTVAVGGLRHGGKSFYALDFEATPADKDFGVLWEFPQGIDNDMGYSYGEATITRVWDHTTNNTKWVAFLPNGYDSDTNKSVLYAVDMEDGSMLHKWNSGLGSNSHPNGMGNPIAADFIVYHAGVPLFGSDQATDYVYAGDLHGNLYRFDVSEIFSDPGGETAPQVLFDGDRDQPITAAPRILNPKDASGDIMVVFGTGKYIELPDRSTAGTDPQYMFGLRDNQALAATYDLNDARLIPQTITEPSAGFRKITENVVDTDHGWKMRLPTQGERLFNKIIVDHSTNTVIAVTSIPEGLDPCLPGGRTWVMAFNGVQGSANGNSLLNDGENDGVYVEDLVLGANLVSTVGGNEGFIVIDGSDVDPSGNGSGTTDTIPFSEKKWGRKSWHRIILD